MIYSHLSIYSVTLCHDLWLSNCKICIYWFVYHFLCNISMQLYFYASQRLNQSDCTDFFLLCIFSINIWLKSQSMNTWNRDDSKHRSFCSPATVCITVMCHISYSSRVVCLLVSFLALVNVDWFSSLQDLCVFTFLTLIKTLGNVKPEAYFQQ